MKPTHFGYGLPLDIRRADRRAISIRIRQAGLRSQQYGLPSRACAQRAARVVEKAIEGVRLEVFEHGYV